MKAKRVFSKVFIVYVFLLSLFLFPIFSFGATINVPADYQNIQAAIDAASGGDTVIVADGTYTREGNKDLDFKGKAITVQSENGAQKCIIDCENEGRGFYFHTGEGTESVVSGFTIRNGKLYGYGGGIYCSSSSPKIMNSTISSNNAAGYEGLTWVPGGNGGGIYCQSSSPTIMNCTISGNNATGFAGSDYGGGGGGICCDNSSSPTISRCTITGNFARRGGGIYCSSSTPIITNCFIYNNNPISTVTFSPGGIIPSYIPSPALGGGIYCVSSYPTIMNCTIRSNNAVMGSHYYGSGGGFYCDSSSSPTITNSIFWDNSPNEIYGDANTTYSDIEGGYPGLGNIDSDPLFVRSGVYQLNVSSSCVDRGTSSGAPSIDIDGNPRPQGLGYDMGAYEFFLAASAPTATTGSATDITDSSATLNGTVNPNGGSSWYYFEYGPSTGYGSTTETQSTGSGTTQLLVSSSATGLAKNATFHYRLVGANSAGPNYGSDQTFVTSPAAPSVTTDPATSVTSNSATLNGTINPYGATTTYYFEYGTTTSYDSTTAAASAGSGTNNVPVSCEITGLELVTTYHYRLVATNGAGTTNGSDQTFTTNALVPSVSTDSATSVTTNSATLNGTVNPNSASTTYYFEYGITTTYGSTTITTGAGSGASAVSVNANIAGLSESTTYHFRLVATNSIGTTSGSDQAFSTTSLPAGPTVTTGSATLITSVSVTLKGKVNPNGSSTEAYFEYGTTTSYGSSTPSEDIGAGTSSVTVSAAISDLIPDTTYHYRLTATNNGGISSGADMTFYTAVIYVSSDGTCAGYNPCYSTIQEAIDAAISGTIIRIAEGSYDENIILSEPKNLTIQGGWDSNFTAQSSSSTVNSMTISDGTIEIDKVMLQ